jgi:hypothetical protein
MDSVIRNRLGYTDTAAGYSEFLTDCQTILAGVQQSRQMAAVDAKKLRVCDIEAALFTKLQGTSK